MKLKIACLDFPSQEILEATEALENVELNKSILADLANAAIEDASEDSYEELAVFLSASTDLDVEFGIINVYDSLDGETLVVVVCDLNADEESDAADEDEEEGFDEWD